MVFDQIHLMKYFFSLFLQNGTLPDIFYKNNKIFSLLICFRKWDFSGFTKKHIFWDSFCTTAFHQAYLTKTTKYTLFYLFFSKTAFHQTHLTKFDKSCSLSAFFYKTTFHQANLKRKNIFFPIIDTAIPN